MKTWHEEFPYDFTNCIINRTFTENALFFDIETTGFSPVNTHLYLIGCAARKGNLLLVDQFFAEQPSEETEVLTAFISHLKNYDTVITYNGIGFDIPYLKAKCENFSLTDPFCSLHYIDIFKIVSQLKFLLKLPNYKQKSIEAFLGIGRNDPFHGGELIEVYKDYTSHPRKEALFFLKQHNYEDVVDMPGLLSMLSYTELFSGGFSVLSVEGNEYTCMDGDNGKELLITLKNNVPVPKRVSCGNEEFYLSCNGEKSKLRIKLYEGELKFFFENYRDYYYLPSEDTAVHKSVAAYVEKEHRKKASASTCYTRKYAIFVPQYEEIAKPLFRKNHKDRVSYFELTEDFSESELLLRRYVEHVLKILAAKKKK